MTVHFREPLPALLGFLARGERSLHLRRAFHQLVEVHRTELAADDPEQRTALHVSLRQPNWFIVLCAPPAFKAASPAKYSLWSSPMSEPAMFWCLTQAMFWRIS